MLTKFSVTFSKLWTEIGRCTVEAEDEEEAREIAQEMLLSGSEEIEWDNMTPEEDRVETINAN